MLHSSLPTATVDALMKSNRVLKEMMADLVELRVRAHRDEKLAVVWPDAAWANRKDMSSTLGFFSANLARGETRCNANSSPFSKIEAQGEVNSERRGTGTGRC